MKKTYADPGVEEMPEFTQVLIRQVEEAHAEYMDALDAAWDDPEVADALKVLCESPSHEAYNYFAGVYARWVKTNVKQAKARLQMLQRTLDEERVFWRKVGEATGKRVGVLITNNDGSEAP